MKKQEKLSCLNDTSKSLHETTDKMLNNLLLVYESYFNMNVNLYVYV